MRPPVGLPRLSRRSRVLITIAVLVLVGIVAGSRAVDDYVDWLWFGEVGYHGVYLTQLATRFELFFAVGAAVGLVVLLNLWLAYRTRPVFVPVSGPDDPVSRYRAVVITRLRLFGLGLPLILALIVGATAQNDWSLVQLYLHGVPFGTKDPVFHLDMGFYLFRLPMYEWLLGWAFVAVALSFFGAMVAHYLFGGIRLHGRGGQLSTPARTQLAVLAGVFVLLKALDYFLGRYQLLLSDRGVKFTGASYTDLHAVLPAKLILLCIAVFCAIAFFAGAFLRNLQLPAIATVLLLLSSVLVGAAWPAIVDQFWVRPNAADREAQSITNSIQATRDAYGLTGKVTYAPYPKDPSQQPASAEQVKQDTGTLGNIRLLDPNILQATFDQLEGRENFYNFPQRLSIDRYPDAKGKPQDYVVGLRELDPNGLADTQRDWVNRHLTYTHGNGFVAAPANQVISAGAGQEGSGGYPAFSPSELNDQGQLVQGAVPVQEPRIYFGELDNDYVVVGGKDGDRPREFDTKSSRYTYSGKGGVPIGGFLHRLAFAAHYGERNLLFSGAIGPDSKIMYNRDPRDRVAKVAPWLTVDSDPYPAVIGGHVQWIVDGYTTLNNYPNSQLTALDQATNDSQSGAIRKQASASVNYIRNSVKATVDAFDGSVKLYEMDPNEPVLKAWEQVFPGVVQPKSAIPPELSAHFRYPEDLFKVQREVLGNYHVDDPRTFYSQDQAWDVPIDPTKENNAELQQPPYYVVAQVGNQTAPTFQLTSALTGLKRGFLASWMSASSDPNNYGAITVLELTSQNQLKGPKQIHDQFFSTPQVNQDKTLFSNPTAEPIYGNLLTLPVAGGLLYVEPLYIQRKDKDAFPQLARVLVNYGGRVGFAANLNDALDAALHGGTPDNGNPTGGGSTTPPPTTTTPPGPSTRPPAGGSPDLDKAVQDINSALQRVQDAQRSGDFAALGQAYKDLQDATNRYLRAKGQQPTTNSSAPAPTPTPSPSGG